jgi:long-subunit acyl-CoA synthetase (AMP-forming)
MAACLPDFTPAGDPKGVLLKHSAVCATVQSLQSFLEEGNFHLGRGDSMLSYLPLAHIFDRWGSGSVGVGGV